AGPVARVPVAPPRGPAPPPLPRAPPAPRRRAETPRPRTTPRRGNRAIDCGAAGQAQMTAHAPPRQSRAARAPAPPRRAPAVRLPPDRVRRSRPAAVGCGRETGPVRTGLVAVDAAEV